MTTKPQLQTEAETSKANEGETPQAKGATSNREWKLNLVGVYFKTFETVHLFAKEPPPEVAKGKKYVLVNFGLVMDERNVERGLATYAEDIGEWPKLYKEAIIQSV